MKSRSLVLLSGEGTTLPLAEAKALFLAYDPSSTFEVPDPRILIAESEADPSRVGRRIAFGRRVGRLVEDRSSVPSLVNGRRVRFRSFDLVPGLSPADPAAYLAGVKAQVDLRSPELELTLVRSSSEYLAVTSPGTMLQGWSLRRPRRRPFFHPSAIFPKLSRALFNMSRCRERETFLDPFAGTGSILLEAGVVGARVVAMDIVAKMASGATANMKRFSQEWDGVVRGDCASLPFRSVDAVATDIPYGRASSTRGKVPEKILGFALPEHARVCPRGSLAVVMHPQQFPVHPGDEFRAVEEHHLHVHKLLTRAITVLERR